MVKYHRHFATPAELLILIKEYCNGTGSKRIMWNDENDNLFKVLEFLNDKRESFPIQCPSCNFEDCHINIHDSGENIGSLWIWCSNCKEYIHATYIVPKWWQNCPTIDESKLEVEPNYLESKKDTIDEWVNKIKEQA